MTGSDDGDMWLAVWQSHGLWMVPCDCDPRNGVNGYVWRSVDGPDGNLHMQTATPGLGF